MAAVLAGAFVALAVGPAAALGPTEIKLAHGFTHFELSTPGLPGNYPLVVLVAGYAVPMVVWDRTVPALVDQDFAVLRFDLYGRGRSARPDVTYDPELFAGQLHELVTTLELPARFHIVASSMGAAVAAAFASRHPGAIDRVVLVSPAGLSEKFPPIVTLLKVPGIGRWYFRRWFKAIMLDHLQENLLADYRAYPHILAEVRRQIGIHGTADAMYSTLRRTLLRNHEDEFRGLGGLHRPTRVLWGTEDRLVPFRDSRAALESSIPHHELCAVPRAAHLPQLEQPRRFNALVPRFLAARPDDRSTPCEKGPLK